MLESVSGPNLMGDWNLVAPSEAGHEGLLGYLYGWQNLVRIDDQGFPGYSLGDTWWRLGADTGVQVTARAHFSGDAGNFGYSNLLGEYQGSIIGVDDTQQGYVNFPTQRMSSSDPLSQFVLNAGDEGRVFTSSQADDRMVTFTSTCNASQYG